MKLLRLSTLAGLALLTACDGGNPTLPRATGNAGAVAFAYSGAHTGSYAAAGESVGGALKWAVGYEQNGTTGLQAAARQNDGSWITVDLSFPTSLAPGTVQIDASDCSLTCPGGAVVFSSGAATSLQREPFNLSRGTIRITSVDGGRLRGTFSGVATAEQGSGTIRITGGQFDVPLVTQ